MSTRFSFYSELAILVGLLQDSIGKSANLRQLALVWTEIGMSQTQRQERREGLVLHVDNLLEAMSSEELNLKTKLEESLESNKVELFDLCKQLSLKEEEVSEIRRLHMHTTSLCVHTYT